MTPAVRTNDVAVDQAVARVRIERELLIARLRWCAFAFSVVQSGITPGDSTAVTWMLTAALGLDSLVTWLVVRHDAGRFHIRVGVLGMAADVVICALVLANNRHDPADPVFLVVLLIALEAAVRWALAGGILGGSGAGALAAVWSWDVIVRTGQGGLEQLSMRYATIAIVGGITGGLVRRLDEERSRLAQLAYSDALTGLANRPALQEDLAAAVAGGEAVALVFLDLDGFKAVNDELGHIAGDAVLSTVADRMRATVRSDDTVARLGGDEFVVVVRGEATDSVRDLATRLRLAVEAPIPAGDRLVRVGASCGAVVAVPGDDVDTLLRRADHAMYEVKRAAGKPAAPELRVR